MKPGSSSSSGIGRLLLEKKMRTSVGFWVTLLIMTFLMVSSESTFTNDKVAIAINHGGSTTAMANRKLKERSSEASLSKALGSINQEDYPRLDPSPSSKAAVNHGPIEHGTPLIPYIPGPAPPAHPKHGSP